MRAIAILAVLLAASPVWAESWYAQRVNQGGGGIGIEHLWSRGASLRSEVVVGAHPIVTGVDGDRYWIVDRMTGKGVSIQRHPNAIRADDPAKRPFGNEAERLQKQGGEYVRDEPIGADATCRLYKLTDERGRQEVCVGGDENALPVYVVNWDRKSKREGRVSYVNWIRGLEIDPAFFRPGAGIEITSYTYDEYVKAAASGVVGPAPVLYPHLLHGDRAQ